MSIVLVGCAVVAHILISVCAIRYFSARDREERAREREERARELARERAHEREQLVAFMRPYFAPPPPAQRGAPDCQRAPVSGQRVIDFIEGLPRSHFNVSDSELPRFRIKEPADPLEEDEHTIVQDDFPFLLGGSQ